MIDAVKACLKEELRMDVISNNLANTSVSGFKRQRISFQDVMNTQDDTPKSGADQGRPAGGELVRMEIDHTQGDFRTTGNPLDLAIHGEGFFKIETPEGVRYTRKGNFTLDAQGVLVTQDGHMVLGQGGPIQVSGSQIEVNGTGAVLVAGEEAGTLSLAAFEDPGRLFPEGQAMFSNPSGEAEIEMPLGSRVNQGSLELANVQVAEEMVSMIHCMRAFESYQKVIRTLDEINQRAINDVSRIR
jgi:flagellar basal-body rod protein FlgG